jgi:Alginate export
MISGAGVRLNLQLKALCCAMIGAGALATTAAAETAPPGDIVSAIQGGKLILDARARVEEVDQSNVADAEAFTLRTHLGWETAAYRGFTALIEAEDVRQLGGGDYNDGVPPAEPFATIADPDVTEINRAQLAWTINPHFGVTLGRQRISFDDQRFVGPSPWRQDEQTFDAARADVAYGRFKATYAYVDHVNRVFAEALDWDGPSHFLNASFAVDPHLKLSGFAYLLDFDEPAAALAQSSATYGVRAAGAATLEGVKLDYAATYATQEDYGSNPASFDLDYVGAELTAAMGAFSGRVMYEELEGDGARGFATPLASLHPFNGWAGVFGATPADGLKDFNVMGTMRPSFSAEHLSNIVLSARYHDFEAERTGADLGDEIDLLATAALTPNISAMLKYADYDGTGAPADTTRAWLGLEFKL